jgi:hypothetical protein
MNSIVSFSDFIVTEINGEPCIKDEVLGKKLGYAEPRMIRNLIKRMIKQDLFGGVTPYNTPQDVSGNQSIVFYLNEKQTIKVISKSETKTANKIIDEVIDVFIAYRQGKLSTHSITPQNFTMNAIVSMAQSFIGLEQEVKEIKADVQSLQDTSAFTSNDCRLYLNAVNAKVDGIISQYPNNSRAAIYPQIHNAVKERYQVCSYKDLPHYKIDEVIDFVKKLSVKVRIAK